MSHNLIDAALVSARGVGTPLWLYEAESIRQRAKQVLVFDCVRYAQKANSNTYILRLLRAMGITTDAVSLDEIERALRAGYEPGTSAHEIVYTADIITETTLTRVLELGIPVNCGFSDMIDDILLRVISHHLHPDARRTLRHRQEFDQVDDQAEFGQATAD